MDILSKMRRNIENELGIVMFYEENLHLFKDKQCRLKAKTLVLASLKHAARFIKAYHDLHDKSAQKQYTQKTMKNALITLGGAMREEKGAEQLYKYQARTAGKKTKTLLLAIAKEEKAHQKIVKKMAADIAKGLPKKERLKLMKKYKLT
jgi:rubrerythrin